MSAKRRTEPGSRSAPRRAESSAPPSRRGSSLALRAADKAGEYELVHPPAARARAEDLEEVHQMIDADEIEIAVDELRWLLTGCTDFLEAHQLLGELALADGDARLARAHFGYAFDIGLGALPSDDWSGKLPFRLPGNRSFLTAAKGLAHCLNEIGQPDRGRAVALRLLRFDPSDPLRVTAWIAQLPPEGTVLTVLDEPDDEDDDAESGSCGA